MTTVIAGGRWQKVDPQKERHLGHIFERDGRRSHDKRCDYCGRWMCYDLRKVAEWGDNSKIGLNNWPEKVHCGSTHCQEYHRRVLKHEKRIQADARRIADERFLRLVKKGLVA